VARMIIILWIRRRGDRGKFQIKFEPISETHRYQCKLATNIVIDWVQSIKKKLL